MSITQFFLLDMLKILVDNNKIIENETNYYHIPITTHGDHRKKCGIPTRCENISIVFDPSIMREDARHLT